MTKSQPSVQTHPPRHRGRPRNEEIHELERRMISVSRQMFGAHGYGATSMAAVARTARVSKNTLYSRFPSKASLFRAIIDHQIEALDPSVKPLRIRDRSLQATLRAYAEETIRASLTSEILQLNRLITSEAVRFPELAEVAAARMETGVDQVAALITDAAERDNITCRDPRKAARMFLTITRGWYYGDILLTNRTVDGPEIREFVEDMLQVFLAGRADW
jgi:TetR/AcrR family transcriptional repressor of mexJK operon